MRIFEQLCWIGTALMALFASFRMLNMWLTAGLSAPQYAAEAAGVMAMAVVPYVFSRAIQQARKSSATP